MMRRMVLLLALGGLLTAGGVGACSRRDVPKRYGVDSVSATASPSPYDERGGEGQAGAVGPRTR